MTASPETPAPRNPTPAKAFATVFLGVFLLVFVAGGLITFTMPERFLATARVRVSAPAQLDSFHSDDTLAAVAKQLELSRVFAERYGQSEPVSAERTLQVLRRGLQVRPIRGTEMADIRVYSLDSGEAAQLANVIAQTGISNIVKDSASIAEHPALVDKAIPSSHPAGASKVFNLVLAALVGGVLGIMAGGLGARLAIMSRPGHPETPPS